MFCPKCGNKLQEDSSFCSDCGTPAPNEQNDSQPQTQDEQNNFQPQTQTVQNNFQPQTIQKSGLATAGMILSIIAIALSVIPFFNILIIIPAILAIIFGIITLCQKRFIGKAVTALVLGLLSLTIAISITIAASYVAYEVPKPSGVTHISQQETSGATNNSQQETSKANEKPKTSSNSKATSKAVSKSPSKAVSQAKSSSKAVSQAKSQTPSSAGYQKIYDEYSKKIKASAPNASITELAEIANEGVLKMAEYMYSATGTDGQYATYESWGKKLMEVYMAEAR